MKQTTDNLSESTTQPDVVQPLLGRGDTRDPYKLSRAMYIVEAAAEYFISLLMIGAFLAKLTSAIGLSDGLTGILTAFVSLGCGFQIFALFLVNKRPVKRWVTVCHCINQLCFALLYLVPVFNISPLSKTIIFFVLLLVGYAINNVINSPKTNWFMSLVDRKKSGAFTADKEIVSLVGGMLFTLFVGMIIDRFEAAGSIDTAFVVGAVAIFLLMLLHTVTLLLSKEKREVEKPPVKTGKSFRNLLRNRTVLKIILLNVLWNIANYATTPFYGSYQIKELGFSMTFISALGIVYALARAMFSKLFGKYADGKSFVGMLNICYAIAAVGFLVNVFTVPSNGKIVYTVYYVLYAIANAGIGNGSLNLIYSEVGESDRMGAYALQQSVAGIVGFLTTTLVSVFVGWIQSRHNMLFGMTIYAQQVVSMIGVVMTIGILIYINLCMTKTIEKNDS